MKRMKWTALFCSAVLLAGLAACGTGKQKQNSSTASVPAPVQSVDAGVLLREAKANAENMKSCTAAFRSSLEFTADGKKNVFQSQTEIVYQADPFALKSTQTSLTGKTPGGGDSYTVSDGDKIWFYSSAGGAWQKTPVVDMDTTPSRQIDILRLLSNVRSEKYVRETTLNSRTVQKLELTLGSEVLRSTIETIVTATGMGSGSSTVVQTLLDSAGDLYGYCYIDAASGEIVRVELDASDALARIFENIDGGGVSVGVSKCEISGEISDVGSAPSVELPAAAADARTVEAEG